jgi:NADH:ubiquinone oxidoreductase subunit 6 (subunit J)
MTAEIVLFWLFACLTCAGAIGVAISQKVVRMAFSLVLTLGSTAVLFLLLGADFVGVTQLMVYVGGTLVLLVFGVMLTASGPFTKIKSSPADGILSGLIGVIFLFIVASTVVAVDWSGGEGIAQKVAIGARARVDAGGFNPSHQGNTTRPLGLSFLSVRADRDLRLENAAASATTDGGAAVVPDMRVPPTQAARTLSTGYLLPFEIVSVHLLVVLIGAAYLARTKRRVGSAG